MSENSIQEVKVKLGEVEYTLRPTFAALTEIESRSGKGCMKLLQEFASSNIGINDLTAVVWGGIIGHLKESGQMIGVGLTYERVGQMILDAGVQNVVAAAAQFLTNGLMGDPQKKTSQTNQASK